MMNQMHVKLTLNEVFYVPNLSKNLLCVPAMMEMGADVLFDEGKGIISKNERKVTIRHLVDSNSYTVNTDGEAHIASTTSQPLEQWHCRFGHLNYSYTDRLIKGKLVEGMSCSSGEVSRECEARVQGKMHRIHPESEPLELTMVESVHPSSLKRFVLTRGLYICSPTRTNQSRMAFQKD